MWPMLHGAWSRDNQLAEDGDVAASDFSVLTGGVGACRCARIMVVVLGSRFTAR
jgi:hypothetical protein